MESLSVVVITKNEETNIRECLKSVKQADEIVIIDDYSTDNTVQICREYTDKIYFKRLESFGDQKQFGIDKCQGDWILVLDADEAASKDLQLEIAQILRGDSLYDGYSIKRKTFYLGKWIRHCGWYVPVLRLFRKEKGRCDLRKVHERVVVEGKLGYLESHILHNSYKNLCQHVEKLNLFTTLEADIFFKKGIKINNCNFLWYLFLKPILAFFRKFILMKGILDGMEGFLISVSTGMVVFLNYAKLWEKQKETEAKDGEEI